MLSRGGWVVDRPFSAQLHIHHINATLQPYMYSMHCVVIAHQHE